MSPPRPADRGRTARASLPRRPAALPGASAAVHHGMRFAPGTMDGRDSPMLTGGAAGRRSTRTTQVVCREDVDPCPGSTRPDSSGPAGSARSSIRAGTWWTSASATVRAEAGWTRNSPLVQNAVAERWNTALDGHEVPFDYARRCHLDCRDLPPKDDGGRRVNRAVQSPAADAQRLDP